MSDALILNVRDLHAGYGRVPVLRLVVGVAGWHLHLQPGLDGCYLAAGPDRDPDRALQRGLGDERGVDEARLAGVGGGAG